MSTTVKFVPAHNVVYHMHPTTGNPAGRWHAGFEKHSDDSHNDEDVLNPTNLKDIPADQRAEYKKDVQHQSERQMEFKKAGGWDGMRERAKKFKAPAAATPKPVAKKTKTTAKKTAAPKQPEQDKEQEPERVPELAYAGSSRDGASEKDGDGEQEQLPDAVGSPD